MKFVSLSSTALRYSYKPVNAALRVLEVLASVNRLRGRATVSEIHQQTGINKATIVRMLETLTHAEYVMRNEDEKTYGVTGKTLMLSAAFDRHRLLSGLIGPRLHEFSDTNGWPSDVALFDNDAMLVIESSRRGGPLCFNRAPGHRFPALGGSLGLTYLAYCTAEEREGIVRQAAKDPAPWNDVARNPAELNTLLSGIRQNGYATMTPSYSTLEYKNRISSIGVPIVSGDTLHASINVLYLRNVLDEDTARDSLLEPLQKLAAQISADIDQLPAEH